MLQLFKNVAERGHWGEMLMDAHTSYWDGRHSQALVTYMLLAELGYEVAQSNAAFILDRHETELFKQGEGFARALMYWGRAASQVQYSFFICVYDSVICYSGLDAGLEH